MAADVLYLKVDRVLQMNTIVADESEETLGPVRAVAQATMAKEGARGFKHTIHRDFDGNTWLVSSGYCGVEVDGPPADSIRFAKELA